MVAQGPAHVDSNKFRKVSWDPQPQVGGVRCMEEEQTARRLDNAVETGTLSLQICAKVSTSLRTIYVLAR